jgi:hypothetical protein
MKRIFKLFLEIIVLSKASFTLSKIAAAALELFHRRSET